MRYSVPGSRQTSKSEDWQIRFPLALLPVDRCQQEMTPPFLISGLWFLVGLGTSTSSRVHYRRARRTPTLYRLPVSPLSFATLAPQGHIIINPQRNTDDDLDHDPRFSYLWGRLFST
jgi:hypothetical protein